MEWDERIMLDTPAPAAVDAEWNISSKASSAKPAVTWGLVLKLCVVMVK